jgi:DNA-binding transcriptional LysR family regulator
MQFTLTELRALAGLAEGLTLVEIGEQLAVAHSSLSRALQLAQERSGVPLIERHGRRLRLTLAGREVALRAQLAVREVEDVNRLIELQRSGVEGLVRVLAGNTPAEYLLPTVIAEFAQQWPRVRVVVRVSRGEPQPTDEYDLCIVPPKPVPSGWRREPLYTDELVFFVSVSNPLARTPEVHWSALGTYMLVGSLLDPYWPQYWTTQRDAPELPDRVIDVGSPEVVKRIVDKVDAVGVAVLSAVAPDFAAGRFVRLRRFADPVPLPYVLESRAGESRPPAVERFRELLLQHAGARVTS